MIEHIERAAASIIAMLVATFLGVIGWFMRVVLTNQKQLDELRSELRAREASRQLERESLNNIRSDIHEIKSDIRVLYQRDQMENM